MKGVLFRDFFNTHACLQQLGGGEVKWVRHAMATYGVETPSNSFYKIRDPQNFTAAIRGDVEFSVRTRHIRL